MKQTHLFADRNGSFNSALNSNPIKMAPRRPRRSPTQCTCLLTCTNVVMATEPALTCYRACVLALEMPQPNIGTRWSKILSLEKQPDWHNQVPFPPQGRRLTFEGPMYLRVIKCFTWRHFLQVKIPRSRLKKLLSEILSCDAFISCCRDERTV